MTKNLNLFNTLSNKKEKFVPINKNKVGMYVCGPTVYDFPHIGNARPLVVFDVLFRLLKKIYGKNKITYVRNITDIDDKIINASKQNNKDIKELTKIITNSFHNDCKYLNCLEPSFEPKATDHVKEMIGMVTNLIKNKHAYENENHVYFSVSSFKEYGKLSNKNLEELIAGSRVEVSKYKKDPLDFVLWKPSETDDPGWDSPWGRGRPGWHLECSIMSEKYLGKKFDIHGGGTDLIFPHHENEIAQSRCANKTKNFANYWIHNGFVTFNKEKMSKSIGNIVAINKLRENIHGEVVRLALLSAHYAQPLDWNEQLIKQSQITLDKWYDAFEKIEFEELEEDTLYPLLENLNTPEYIAKLHVLYREAGEGNKSAKSKFLSACNLVGLLENKKSWISFKKSKVKIDDDNFIELRIKERNEARKKGDYEKADAIRRLLEYDGGVILEDKEDGQTTWKHK